MSEMSTPSFPQPEIPYSALIGQVIKQARQAKGRHQSEMANVLGLSQSAYSRLEGGDTMLNVWQLRQCAAALDMTSVQLLQQVQFLEDQLEQQHVPVVEAKKTNPGGVLIGVALLVALLAGSR